MADNRKEYTLHVNGVPHTVLTTPEEAEKRGLRPAEKAVTPADKSGSVRTK